MPLPLWLLLGLLLSHRARCEASLMPAQAPAPKDPLPPAPIPPGLTELPPPMELPVPAGPP